jgi:DNA-directed RNA polymerase subunit RPC12/RpoP
MDFTKVKCISQQCKDKNITMQGAVTSFGGRAQYAGLKCPECGVKIMVIPVNSEYEYSTQATTEEERRRAYIKKLKEESELELAQRIIAAGKQVF